MINYELYFTELRKNSAIVQDSLSKYKAKLAEAAATLIWLCDNARTQGLLWLAEAAEGKRVQSLVAGKELGFLLNMICDGTAPEEVENVALKKYCARNYTGIEGFLFLVYLDCVLGIQADKSPYLMRQELLAVMPEPVHKAMDELIEADKKAEKERGEERWKMLFMESLEINDIIAHPSIIMLDYCLEHMSDQDVQRLLRDIKFHDLAVAMQKLGGGSYKMIYKNLSIDLRATLLSEMDEIGQEDLIYIAEMDSLIMKRILELMLISEIEVPEAIKNIYNISV